MNLAKCFVLTMMVILIASSFASMGANGQGSGIVLEEASGQIFISTERMDVAIRLDGGILEVGPPGLQPIMMLEFPSVMAFDAPVSGEFSPEDSQYASDLSERAWEVVSSRKSNSLAYGDYAEVVMETGINLMVPDIPAQNPYAPIDIPGDIMDWGRIQVKFLVVEKNVSLTVPGGSAYQLTGLSEVKIDIRIIMENQYSPETVCIKQKLTITNQSLQLALQTPGGDIDISPGSDSPPISIPETDESERSFGLRSRDGTEQGKYSWVGISDVDGAPVSVENFYASAAKGLDLYFCYNVAPGSSEILHDPSISLNPDVSGIVSPPTTNVLTRHRAIFLGIALISGVFLAVASIALRSSRQDPLDLDKNYYYRKKK